MAGADVGNRQPAHGAGRLRPQPVTALPGMANNRLHAFLESMKEMQSLQRAEVEALTRPVGAAGRWPVADAVACAGFTQRGAEPSNGIPVGSAPAWVDPALPPVTLAHDALDTIRDMRERQEEQATNALLRAAKLRALYDRLHAKQLGVAAENIHSSRRATFLRGNEYMHQVKAAAVQPRSGTPGALGYGKRCDSAGGPCLSGADGGGGAATDAAAAALEPHSAGGVGVVAITARCAEEFGRREDSSIDLAAYQLVWQTYTAWATGMFDHGRGFEIPHLGRVVVQNQRFGGSAYSELGKVVQRKRQASFAGSQRTLGRHGLTQRLVPGSATAELSAHHRAARVNPKVLSQSCGLHVDDVIRKLKEIVWCTLQMAGEQPEAEMQINLGPCVLYCRQRRLSMEFHRPPGGEDDGSFTSPPASPVNTPRGSERSPSVDSMVSDASSWSVSSVGSSVAARGRWARWPLKPLELGEALAQAQGQKLARVENSVGSDGSWLDSDGSWLGDDIAAGGAMGREQHPRVPVTPPVEAAERRAEVVQLSAANTALGAENALLREKLDRLLNFTTGELQRSAATPAQELRPAPPPAARPQRAAPARRVGLAVPVGPPVRIRVELGAGSSYPTW